MHEIGRARGRLPFIKALEAFIAELLRIDAEEAIEYGYHGMSPSAFLMLRVGYRAFYDVVMSLKALGYIEHEKGYKEHTGKGAKGAATRLKATPKLIAIAASYGIMPAEWRTHFKRLPRPLAIPDPIVLKTASTWASKGKRMIVDRHDATAIALAKPINELNAFFQSQVIEPDLHYAFQRIFANGDRQNYRWDQGGRIYSVGDSYQHKPQEERAAITINGEPTIELDIKASHLIILHALAKEPLPPHLDPYEIEGLDRGAVKTFVAMTLGYDKFHKDWTADARDNYAKKRAKKGLAPLDLPPIAQIRDAILHALPLLHSWPASCVRWGYLQFVESEIMLETVHTLALGHGVAALPVHDSIIVPVSMRQLADTILKTAFIKHVGVQPTVEANVSLTKSVSVRNN